MLRSPESLAARRAWAGLVAILGLALCPGSGCTGTTGHLAVATTREVDLRAVDFNMPQGRHVVGRSCTHVIGVVPLGIPNFGDALDNALSQAGGQALFRVVVGYEVFDIPFVYGFACYVVEGDAR